MPINTIDLLGVTFNEQVIGNLIVGLMNYSKNFRDSFSQHILEISNYSDFEIKSYTKIATSKGVPDIVVISENKNEVILSIIECKLKANSGHNQTLVYTEQDAKDELLCSESKNKKITFKYIYLTLENDREKNSTNFISKTFKDLVENVWVEIEDSGLDRIYKDFCSKMMQYYSLQDLPKNSRPISLLLNGAEKEKMFIKFRELVLSLDYPNNLSVEFFGKGNGGDELSFTSKFVKNRWIGKEARWKDDLYEVGEETFDIHIESEFHITNEKLLLYIHYETNPYITRYKLKNVALDKNIEAFEKRRNLVKDFVHNEIDRLGNKHIKKYEGTNTIAYFDFNFEKDTTIGDFKEVFIYYIEILSNIVEDALDYIEKREKIK